MNIAVYCSSRKGLAREYVEIARATGAWIGDNSHTLVYGGNNRGLMHEVAQAAHDHGARVVGVNINQFRHMTDPLVDEIHYTADLGERKALMYRLADLFVVLPGGLGTVDEWMATLSQLVVENDMRQVVVTNLNNMYDPLLEYLTRLAQSPFAHDGHMSRIITAQSQQQLIEILDRQNEK